MNHFFVFFGANAKQHEERKENRFEQEWVDEN